MPAKEETTKEPPSPVSEAPKDYKTDPNDPGVLIEYTGNKRVFDMPDEITAISTGVFFNHKELQVVHFSKNSKISYIGDFAFANTGIYKLEWELPQNNVYIGKSAFTRCENLKQIEISGKSFKFDDGAFAYNNQLEETTIRLVVDENKIYNQGGIQKVVEGLLNMGRGVFNWCKKHKKFLITLVSVATGVILNLTLGAYMGVFVSSVLPFLPPEAVRILQEIFNEAVGQARDSLCEKAVDIIFHGTPLEGTRPKETKEGAVFQAGNYFKYKLCPACGAKLKRKKLQKRQRKLKLAEPLPALKYCPA
jgi:hypothetical protein